MAGLASSGEGSGRLFSPNFLKTTRFPVGGPCGRALANRVTPPPGWRYSGSLASREAWPTSATNRRCSLRRKKTSVAADCPAGSRDAASPESRVLLVEPCRQLVESCPVCQYWFVSPEFLNSCPHRGPGHRQLALRRPTFPESRRGRLLATARLASVRPRLQAHRLAVGVGNTRCANRSVALDERALRCGSSSVRRGRWRRSSPRRARSVFAYTFSTPVPPSRNAPRAVTHSC